MINYFPFDLQQVICHYGIGQNAEKPFVQTAILVNKSWATFVCRILYRHYRIKNYLTFIGFVKTVTNAHTVLPYGLYIRSIDLTPVNKYGIDMRAHRLMRCCPNIVSMTLGHPTTLKAETIREIAKYNTRLHTLSMGGIESFPFMLDCNFSALEQLRHVVLKTTPLLNSAFLTLPTETLRTLRLIQMDAITPDNLLDFCKTHARLKVLAIEKCRALTTGLGEALAKLITPNNTAHFCRELKEIELNGHYITDENIKALFIDVPTGTGLYRLKLINTSVRSLDILRYSHLRIRHLEVSNNRYLVNI